MAYRRGEGPDDWAARARMQGAGPDRGYNPEDIEWTDASTADMACEVQVATNRLGLHRYRVNASSPWFQGQPPGTTDADYADSEPQEAVSYNPPGITWRTLADAKYMPYTVQVECGRPSLHRHCLRGGPWHQGLPPTNHPNAQPQKTPQAVSDRINAQYRAEGWGHVTDKALGVEPANVESQARQVAQWAHDEIERLRALLCVADDAIMRAHGCFPIDRSTDKGRRQHASACLVRSECCDDYLTRTKTATAATDAFIAQYDAAKEGGT